MSLSMKNKIEVTMGLIMIMVIAAIASHAADYASASAFPEKSAYVVVIDAGHGGMDPGKVGVNNQLEKDINLAVAMKLKEYLEQNGIKVIMTRDEDEGLYDSGSKNKKRDDMNKRCELIEESGADLVVSIHQNSYHEEYVCGPQVFYYKNSQEGKKLAELLQKRFDFVVGDRNTRQAKPNDNYYLLLHTSCPIVIVESGFLSTWEEAELLSTEEYQEKVAWTIHMGILQYLNLE